jgi:hypothetical protein
MRKRPVRQCHPFLRRVIRKPTHRSHRAASKQKLESVAEASSVSRQICRLRQVGQMPRAGCLTEHPFRSPQPSLRQHEKVPTQICAPRELPIRFPPQPLLRPRRMLNLGTQTFADRLVVPRRCAAPTGCPRIPVCLEYHAREVLFNLDLCVGPKLAARQATRQGGLHLPRHFRNAVQSSSLRAQVPAPKTSRSSCQARGAVETLLANPVRNSIHAPAALDGRLVEFPDGVRTRDWPAIAVPALLEREPEPDSLAMGPVRRPQVDLLHNPAVVEAVDSRLASRTQVGFPEVLMEKKKGQPPACWLVLLADPDRPPLAEQQVMDCQPLARVERDAVRLDPRGRRRYLA